MFVTGDQELSDFPGIIRPLTGQPVLEESASANEIKFGRFLASDDFLEDFTVDYEIYGCDQEWALTDDASNSSSSQDSDDNSTSDGMSEEEQVVPQSPYKAPRYGTLKWEAGDSTPKSVKLQINADSAVSQNYTTCVGGVILHNPSHPDAFLHLDNGGTKFEYLDDELPENGRVFRAQPTNTGRGEESVTMTLIRRGYVDRDEIVGGPTLIRAFAGLIILCIGA